MGVIETVTEIRSQRPHIDYKSGTNGRKLFNRNDACAEGQLTLHFFIHSTKGT